MNWIKLISAEGIGIPFEAMGILSLLPCSVWVSSTYTRVLSLEAKP
jgi:hypothetical protein